MKRRLGSLFLLVVLMLSLFGVSAFARLNVIDDYTVSLSFSGSSANCYVRIVAQDSDADISATVKLQKKNVFGSYGTVETWYPTGTGTLTFSDSYTPVMVDTTYRLVVNISASSNNGSDSFIVEEESST